MLFKADLSAATKKLSFSEFNQQYMQFKRACAFFKVNSNKEIARLQNDYDSLIVFYKEIIPVIQQQLKANEDRIQELEYYEEDKDLLKPQISNEIARQKKYRDELIAQLAKTRSLKVLFSLNPGQLADEARTNKSSALLITQTPELIAHIPDDQLISITHQDHEVINALGSVLKKREYTFETAVLFTTLKQQVQTHAEIKSIEEKEEAQIRNLLIKINHYLDKKIANAIQENRNPWALGYFSSQSKLNKEQQTVPVPQGVYALKEYLNQLNTLPSTEILSKIKNVLHTKNINNQDNSLFQQVKRFISYLFGCSQSIETTQEYEYLEQVCLGKQFIF